MIRSPLTDPSYSWHVVKESNLLDDVDQSEVLRALLNSERRYLVPFVKCCVVNMSGPSSSPRSESHHPIYGSETPLEDWRPNICRWFFRVIDHFLLDREIVTIAMNIFDRFLVMNESHDSQQPYACFDDATNVCGCLNCRSHRDGRTYQLAATTSLFLAVKLNSPTPTQMNDSDSNMPIECSMTSSKRYPLRALSIMHLVELTRGQFTVADISAMERRILKTLSWLVHPPSSRALCHFVLICCLPSPSLIPSALRDSTTFIKHYEIVLHVLQELSRYLTELAVCLGGVCSASSPSKVSVASILVAMDLLTHDALPEQVRHAFIASVDIACNWNSRCDGWTQCEQIYRILSQLLSPEMLLDESAMTIQDGQHPIAMARDMGLLNLNFIHKVDDICENLCHEHHYANDVSIGWNYPRIPFHGEVMNKKQSPRSPRGVKESLHHSQAFLVVASNNN